MSTFLQKPAQLLAAFAVATLGMGAPAALANDRQSEPTTQSVAYGQEELASLSSNEALEQSNGRVLLHFGSDFIPETVQAVEAALEAEGISVDAYYGAEQSDSVSVYFYGNAIPTTYSSDEIGDMMATIEILAKKYNLIDSPDIVPNQ